MLTGAKGDVFSRLISGEIRMPEAEEAIEVNRMTLGGKNTDGGTF